MHAREPASLSQSLPDVLIILCRAFAAIHRVLMNMCYLITGAHGEVAFGSHRGEQPVELRQTTPVQSNGEFDPMAGM